MNSDTATSESTIDFPSSPRWFQTIRRLVFTASTECGFSDRDAGQVAMAVDEALTNIYRHGYQLDEQGRITLHVRTVSSPAPNIDITIEDEGQQVKPSTIQSRNLDDVKPGGLGVHLIQTIMDQSHWEPRDTHGMRLLMSKTAHANTDTKVQTSKQEDG